MTAVIFSSFISTSLKFSDVDGSRWRLKCIEDFSAARAYYVTACNELAYLSASAQSKIKTYFPHFRVPRASR